MWWRGRTSQGRQRASPPVGRIDPSAADETVLIPNFGAKSRCAEKLISPAVSIRSPRPALLRQKFFFLFFGNYGPIASSCFHRRGVSRSSRTLEAGCGGRAGCGRRPRLERTAKSCGPGTPTLVSRSRRCSRIARTTVAKKPGAPRRARISRNTIARGRPGCFGRTCGSAACFLLHADHGSGELPAFPAPSIFARVSFGIASGALAPREYDLRSRDRPTTTVKQQLTL